MSNSFSPFKSHCGILFQSPLKNNINFIASELNLYLSDLNICPFLVFNYLVTEDIFFYNIVPSQLLKDEVPYCDTKNICNLLEKDISEKKFFLSEIILSMSCSPVSYVFDSFEDFKISILFRFNTASSAKKTKIAFDTESAERPTNFWNYSSDHGFLLNKDIRLDDALIATIHPPLNGQYFTFACLRACEYVLLLALSLTLKEANPKLLHEIEDLWRKKSLMNNDFTNAFLQEHGSYENPLPVKFYVPGDRVWFRNPDEYSSNVTGFEGSWVIYIGSGLFCNFWDHTKPTSLDLKCVEVYHWRHGAQINTDGELFMNEPFVATCVASTLANTEIQNDIIIKMMKIRDPSGEYADGGFVDASRDEFRAIDKFLIA